MDYHDAEPEMKIFEVLGEPRGKERPRSSRKSGTFYTPRKTQEYEKLIKNSYFTRYGKEQIDGAIWARIECFYTIPKKTSKKQTALMLEGKVRPIKKPDLDNIAKVVLDSLNGTAYKDDSQVVELSIKKYYSTEGKVRITLYELEDKE